MCHLHSSAFNSYFPRILNELPKCPWTGLNWPGLAGTIHSSHCRADGWQGSTLPKHSPAHAHCIPAAYLGEVFVPIPHGMALPLRYTGLQLDVFSRWRKTNDNNRETERSAGLSLCPSDHVTRLPQQASHFKEDTFITGSPSIAYNITRTQKHSGVKMSANNVRNKVNTKACNRTLILRNC